MDALLAITPVKMNNVNELRELCDVIEIHTRNLQLFDICAQNYGPVLISIILSKLPNEIKLEISRQMPQGKWDIKQLMEVMKKEIASRERCVPEVNSSLSDDFTDNVRSSASTLFTHGKKIVPKYGNRKKGNSCLFCDKPHQSTLCRIVASVDDRKAIVRRKNKCYVCLTSNHMARDCYS